MKVVLDNNILFTLMNPNSVNSYLFSLLDADLFVPQYIKQELEEHREECLLKSGLSEQEFDIRLAEIEESVEFCSLSSYSEFLEKAINSLDDPEDSPYLALVIHLKADIWSNDPHLKGQDLIRVYTTKELIEKLIYQNES